MMDALGRDYVANQPADAQTPKDGEKQRRAAIVRALLGGHSWVLTAEELATVQAKAGDAWRGELERRSDEKEVDVYVFDGQRGGLSLLVDDATFDDLEGLEAKLVLYPAGIPIRFPQNDAAEPEVKAIRAWAAAHGRAVR
ncbi:MAG TPA: hypothetical protein VH253_08930 [Phycisphaerae bacterium]|nr:hypothetical protein [Phycisphaerae bacterium]